MIAGDILGERTRIEPRKTALVCVATGERLSYGELDLRARRMAQLWQTHLGLRKGDRIGILAQNSVECVGAFFAAGKSGVILVPLNARQTAHELGYVVQDAGLAALLYETQFAEIARELQQLRAPMKLLALDGTEWETAWKQADEAAFHNTPCAPEDVYCLLYTSGTTGRPKGVMIPHRMIVWNAYNTAVGWQMRDSDVIPIFTPMYHAGGLTVFLTAGILLGCTMIVHRHFDARQVWRTIERERATVLMAVPTIFKMMMEAPEFATARLVDDAGREVQPGEVGELWLKGPHVCLGYWNNPAATVEVLDREGWFHTGDKARRDVEGNYTIAGRAKEMFISGGVNVYPAEVEAELLLHPAVEDAAVVGVEHEKWGEVGAAFVVLRADRAASPEELAEFLSHKLARYKLPQHYRFVMELPRTAYGKVVRPELQRQFRTGGK